MTSRSVLLFGVLWLLSFAAMSAVIGSTVDFPELWRLQDSYSVVRGEVLRLVPNSHGMIEVSYRVARHEYRRQGMPGALASSLDVGSPVTVYYLPGEPAVASLSPPRDRLLLVLPTLLLGAFMMATGFTFAIMSISVARGPFYQLSVNLVSPRIFSASIAVGVLLSLVLTLNVPIPGLGKLVGVPLVLFGAGAFLHLAWKQGLSWWQLLRSLRFWVAIVFMMAGVILTDVLRA